MADEFDGILIHAEGLKLRWAEGKLREGPVQFEARQSGDTTGVFARPEDVERGRAALAETVTLCGLEVPLLDLDDSHPHFLGATVAHEEADPGQVWMLWDVAQLSFVRAIDQAGDPRLCFANEEDAREGAAYQNENYDLYSIPVRVK